MGEGYNGWVGVTTFEGGGEVEKNFFAFLDDLDIKKIIFFYGKIIFFGRPTPSLWKIP